MKYLKTYESFSNEEIDKLKNNIKESIDSTLNISVQSINKDDIPELLRIKYDYFSSNYANREKHDEYSIQHTDWDISKKLVDGDKIIGGYFLRKSTIQDQLVDDYGMENLNSSKWVDENLIYDIRPLYNLKGIEGVSLFINKEYKNKGLGQILIDGVMSDPNVDYMFGWAYKSLGNIKQWMKRRYLVLDFYDYSEEEKMDKSCYLSVETKGLKLKMTTFGFEYADKHKDLNFNPVRGNIIS